MKKILSNLLVVGSVAYDSIQTPFAKTARTLGGSGSYFSLSAKNFVKPSLVGVVGNDFKAIDIKILKDIADISGLEHQKGKTFHWAGKYSFDLNSRETLKTELGVFADFKPTLSPVHSLAEYVFLGNIHPKLQLDVLHQVKSASRRTKFVGLDTMNFWIESALPDLKKVLKEVDVLIINDSEARQLSKEHNLLKAAKKITTLMSARGASSNMQEGAPLARVLVIKRGEYGLLMFSSVSPSFKKRGLGGVRIFNLPGFPLEDAVDPTGAGDSFAGGFMGYLTKTNNTSWENLKLACVAGSVMGSFCVEQLGTKGLIGVTEKNIRNRLKEFKKLVNY